MFRYCERGGLKMIGFIGSGMIIVKCWCDEGSFGVIFLGCWLFYVFRRNWMKVWWKMIVRSIKFVIGSFRMSIEFLYRIIGSFIMIIGSLYNISEGFIFIINWFKLIVESIEFKVGSFNLISSFFILIIGSFDWNSWL